MYHGGRRTQSSILGIPPFPKAEELSVLPKNIHVIVGKQAFEDALKKALGRNIKKPYLDIDLSEILITDETYFETLLDTIVNQSVNKIRVAIYTDLTFGPVTDAENSQKSQISMITQPMDTLIHCNHFQGSAS